MKGAAFFDLDNTLIRGSSLFHVGRDLARTGLVPRRELVRFAAAQFRYVYTRTEIAGGAQGLADRLMGLIAGYQAGHVARSCDHAVRRVFPRVAVPRVVSHVREHQKQGRPTYLVTASPSEIASRISSLLAMDGYIATELEIENGVYTGRLAAPVVHGPRKAAEVAVLAAREGIALGASYMYSDSANDLPLLRQVRYPVVVNGNRYMYDVALTSGWAFLDTERPARCLWPSSSPDLLSHNNSMVPLANHLHHAQIDG